MFQGEGTVQAKAGGVYTSRERSGFEEMTAVWFGQRIENREILAKLRLAGK